MTEVLEVGSRNAEVGKWKSEVGPVVVPKERDYAAAGMRKWELDKFGSGNAEGGM